MTCENSTIAEGRNVVIEALRSGRDVEKLYIMEGCRDGPIQTILREAKKRRIPFQFVPRERLEKMSPSGRHQGVILYTSAYSYASMDDVFMKAGEKGEDPFLILLDGIEDPHNLGAIIRTANTAGAHGVIIPRHRAVGLTDTVARISAGAISYTPVVRVGNLSQTILELKERGLWFVCGDMEGELLYDVDLRGPMGLVVGGEGSGVGRRVREMCDFRAAIPMKGDICSLNASVATGIMAYEILRQRMGK